MLTSCGVPKAFRLAALVVGVSACGTEPPPPPPPPPAVTVSVTVAPTTGAVEVGGTLQMSATATGANGSGQPVIQWTTGNAAVATVSQAGLVTGAGVGTTSITATATYGTAQASASAAVEVRPNTRALSLTLGGAGGGSVRDGPGAAVCAKTAGAAARSCTLQLTAGQVVTLVAEAEAGSQFGGWSGDCGGQGNCQVSMTTGRTVTAAFGVAPSGVRVASSLLVLGVGSRRSVAFTASDGTPWTTPPLIVTSRQPSVAGATGVDVTALATGVADIVGAVGSFADSARVAVVLPNGYAVAVVRHPDSVAVVATPGGTVTLSIFLIAPSGGVGDVASVQGTVTWPTSGTTYVSGSFQPQTPSWTVLGNENGVGGGTLAFAGFAASGSRATVELARFQLQIGPGATVRPISVAISGAGTATGQPLKDSMVPVTTWLRVP